MELTVATNDGGPFRVDRFPRVNEQIRQLAAKAAAIGKQVELIDALKSVVEQLTTRAVEWGDPMYRTRKSGGRVYQAIRAPVLVRYVVFEAEREVMIMSVTPLPGSYLE
jgi:hypothetical protein